MIMHPDQLGYCQQFNDSLIHIKSHWFPQMNFGGMASQSVVGTILEEKDHCVYPAKKSLAYHLTDLNLEYVKS